MLPRQQPLDDVEIAGDGRGQSELVQRDAVGRHGDAEHPSAVGRFDAAWSVFEHDGVAGGGPCAPQNLQDEVGMWPAARYNIGGAASQTHFWLVTGKNQSDPCRRKD